MTTETTQQLDPTPAAAHDAKDFIVPVATREHLEYMEEKAATALMFAWAAAVEAKTGKKPFIHTDIAKDMAASGLSAQTLVDNEFIPVEGAQLKKALNREDEPGHFAGQGVAIPYRGLDGSAQPDGRGKGLVRVRLYNEALQIAAGAKYLSPIGSQHGIFIPAAVREAIKLGRQVDSLVVTEGEKKALAAAQVGINCISIPGVYMWNDPAARVTDRAGKDSENVSKISNKTPLHPVLVEVIRALGVKTVVVLADSDAKKNKQVAKAMLTFANAIKKQLSVRAQYAVCPATKTAGGKFTKTGLDDWLVRTGSIGVRAQLAAWADSATDTSGAEGGYVPLGYDGPTNIIWSEARQCIHKFNGKDFNETTVLSVLGHDWCLANFSTVSKEGIAKFDFTELRGDIIQQCQNAGYYDEKTERGTGAWKHKDELIVNGRAIFGTKSGEVPRVIDSTVYPVCDDLGVTADTPAATDEEVAELIEVIKTWNFARESDRALLLGWMAVAPLAGAMTRRPHTILTGGRGTGKTTLMDMIANMLGGSALKADGSATAAGIRQRLGKDARALILDEFEGKGQGDRETYRVANIIETARSAYSDGTGEGTLRGTADGSGTSYTMRFNGLFGMIMPPKLEAADQTRFVVLNLAPLAQGTREHAFLGDEDAQKALGAKFRMRMFMNFETVVENARLLKEAMIGRGLSARAADTVGTLLSGFYTAIRAKVLTPSALDKLLDKVDLNSHTAQVEQASDERECIEHMLGRIITAQDADGFNERMTVGSVLEAMHSGQVHYSKSLAAVGLQVLKGELRIAQSASHEGISMLFKDSKFAGGGWATILKRVPGARADMVLKLAGASTRMVAIPLSFALPDSEEELDADNVIEMKRKGITQTELPLNASK